MLKNAVLDAKNYENFATILMNFDKLLGGPCEFDRGIDGFPIGRGWIRHRCARAAALRGVEEGVQPVVVRGPSWKDSMQ